MTQSSLVLAGVAGVARGESFQQGMSSRRRSPGRGGPSYSSVPPPRGPAPSRRSGPTIQTGGETALIDCFNGLKGLFSMGLRYRAAFAGSKATSYNRGYLDKGRCLTVRLGRHLTPEFFGKAGGNVQPGGEHGQIRLFRSGVHINR
jgi:hypothetical protein